jgi:hypothetical protein
MSGVNGNGKPQLDDWPRLLLVGVNTEIRYKADFANDAKARHSLTHNYTVKELTLEELAAEIGRHYNICHPGFNGNKFHRKKEFCQSADYVGIDIDNDQEVDELDAQGNQILDARGKSKKIKVRCKDEDYFSFDAALGDPFIKKHAALMYPTPSDTPEWNRFRVLFPFPRRLEASWFKDEGGESDHKRFELFFDEIARLLIWKYGSDEACKDCSRFFYGTNQPDRVVVLNGYLTPDAINQLRIAYKDAHPKPEEHEFKAAINIAVDSADAQERAKLYGERALLVAKQQIEQAAMGHKNKTRARMAYLIGGYVAGGLLNEERAFAELENSVRANTDNYSKSWKTIDSCFAEGMRHPIKFEDCERWRLKFAPKDDKDEEIIAPDGEIIDPKEDPPISDDPALETYLRKLQAHASRFLRARMMMAVALGFTKLPWRLLNGILAYERNKLCVKVITNEMMLNLYAKSGERASNERTLRRDKKKLWKVQRERGIELVWYMPGFENPETGQRVGSRYKSNLDRWTLEAIALAIKKKGKYTLKDAEIKAACEEIAKAVPRCQVEDSKPGKPEPDATTIQKGAEDSLKRIVPKFHEAWDMEDLTLGERHIRGKNVLRSFGTMLFIGADASASHGKQQRKRNRAQARLIANTIADEILSEVSPVKSHVKGLNSSPFFRTADKKEDKNGQNETNLHGGQNVPHAANEESTTYGWTVENEESTNELRRIEAQRAKIRLRFAEIQPANGRVFVEPSNSDEVIRLAEELDELDRQEAALLAGEFYPPIVPSGPDPLVDALLEDDMEGFV